MKLSDFDFVLPKELIAQYPTNHRNDSRLLAIDQDNGGYIDTTFNHIIDFLRPGDTLVLNDSKVIKAKLVLPKGDKNIDLNLSHSVAENIWRGFARPSKKLDVGDQFIFDSYSLLIDKKLDMGEVEVRITNNNKDIRAHEVFQFLERYGAMPLPPYIRRGIADNSDNERYQTIYSKTHGSCAAPTAGLHFTENLLNQVKDKGASIEYVTLHVGAGTFLPVKTENIAEHKMHHEYYEISAQTMDNIVNTSGRVVAVGTTVARTLESAARSKKLTNHTNIFITPGFEFQIVDALITNFHLPKSTLLMLVSAFAGYERIMDMYNYAVHNKFRFFSYGDAMFLRKLIP